MLKGYYQYKNRFKAKLQYPKKEILHNLLNAPWTWRRLKNTLQPSPQKLIMDMTINGDFVISIISFHGGFVDLLWERLLIIILLMSSNSISRTPYAISTEINYCLRKSMFFFPTTDGEVISTFRSLKNTTSQDNNDTIIKPIKFIIDIIAPVLTYLFNLVYKTSIFPKLMQIAKITILQKGGNVNDSKYRPISILSGNRLKAKRDGKECF